jgi:hypothetical protein
VIRAVKTVDHTKAMLNITIDGYPEDVYTWWPNSDVNNSYYLGCLLFRYNNR